MSAEYALGIVPPPQSESMPIDSLIKPGRGILPDSIRPKHALDAASIGYSRSGRLIMHVNKVHHVTTINRVAKDLGENENWLSNIANESPEKR